MTVRTFPGEYADWANLMLGVLARVAAGRGWPSWLIEGLLMMGVRVGSTAAGRAVVCFM